MDPVLSCLQPKPGWSALDTEEIIGGSIPVSVDIVGKHCILELYECDAFRLNDEAFVRTTITAAAKNAGATLLNLITHRFIPQGVTGLALLAESHISIHTWPESGYAAVDVFTCGDHTMPDLACKIMCSEFRAKNHVIKTFLRQTPEGLSGEVRNPQRSPTGIISS